MNAVTQICIKKENGMAVEDWDTITVDQWKGMNAMDKVKLVQSTSVKFFNGAGETVPVGEAVKMLM